MILKRRSLSRGGEAGFGLLCAALISLSRPSLPQEGTPPIKDAAKLYAEAWRPKFHFTPARNWTNDPNGLVYYKGVYHLFFQHNPFGTEWGNMSWGHATSPDLVHWTEHAPAIRPDRLGTIFSGSAIVDADDTAGFRTGGEKVLVAVYTSAGGTSPESQGRHFTQSLAYSNDRGVTWTKYAKNPVLGHVAGSNRDPKVIWYEPTKTWIMALYLDGTDYALFGSKNLREWTKLCDVAMPGTSECPDIFDMPVDGEPGRRLWVFWGANGNYRLGTFDGRTFRPGTDVLRSLWGANDYAAQTWSGIPGSDGRRIQISWMSGGRYPGMPFNQQMSFPRELRLRTTPQGVRLSMRPVFEVEKLRRAKRTWKGVVLKADAPALSLGEGELWDIEAELEPGPARAIGLRVRGAEIVYDSAAKTLSCLGRTAPLEPSGGRISLRVLVDRTSIEVFAGGGLVTMCSCFLPDGRDRALEAFARGGPARIAALALYELASAWE
jgi:fructan beta-fructosidase